MFIFALLLLTHFWTTVKSDCGLPPSVTLTCGHKRVNANWSSRGCNHSRCKGYLSCTNGTRQYSAESDDGDCNPTFEFPNIPMEYYNCTVKVHYKYLDSNRNLIKSPTTTKSCVFNKIELQNDYFKNQSVGKYHEVHCVFYTGEVVNSDNVSISWIGPNGVIANDSSRITVIPTTSDGYIHTSILQFSYISEEDENTSYNCTASLSEDRESLFKSFTMNNLTIPKPTVKLIAIGSQTVGDKLSLRCDVNITKGISGSVNFVWKINDTESRENGQVVKNPLSNTLVQYTNFLNISSLNLTDNNTVYSCQAVINTSRSVNASGNASLTINVTATTPANSETTPQITHAPPPTSSQSNHTNPTASSSTHAASPENSQVTLAAIILSAILTLIMIGFIVAIFVVCHHKWIRSLMKRPVRKDCNEDDDQYKIPNFDDNDFSVIGKDEPSTVEYLKYDRVTRSNSDSQMPKIDEECSSINSQTDFITNEEMLTCVNGGDANEKQHRKTDNGYSSDTSMSHKKLGLPIASTNNTEQLDSSPSGDYIQSSISPYVDETIALQQHSMSPLSDPNKSYSSLSQLQSSEHPQPALVSNSDNLVDNGEYVAESMAIKRCDSSVDVVFVDFGYLDYNAAVDQNVTKQAVPYSSDADTDTKIHKPSADSDSFPYVALNDNPTGSMPCINDQLGSSCIAHDDTKGNADLSYLQKVGVAGSEAMDGIYFDHSSPVQQSDTEQIVNTTEQTLLHETDSTSSISFEYIQETNDGGYISEQ